MSGGHIDRGKWLCLTYSVAELAVTPRPPPSWACRLSSFAGHHIGRKPRLEDDSIELPAEFVETASPSWLRPVPDSSVREFLTGSPQCLTATSTPYAPSHKEALVAAVTSAVTFGEFPCPSRAANSSITIWNDHTNSAPVLLDPKTNGQTIPALVQSSTMGFVDVVRGSVLWRALIDAPSVAIPVPYPGGVPMSCSKPAATRSSCPRSAIR